MRYVWRENPARFLTFGQEVFGIEPVDESDEAVEDAVTVIIARVKHRVRAIANHRFFIVVPPFP